MTRALRLFGLIFGVAVLAWLLWRSDVAAVVDVFAQVGWAFTAIIAVRALTIVADTAAWRCLLPRGERLPFTVLLALRWVGESINTTLPAAQIGGEVVRARLLQQRAAAPGHAAASVAVDFCLSLLTQIIFTLIGFALLVRLSGSASLWPAVITAALVPVFAIASWELLVRRRLLILAASWAKRFQRHRIAAALGSLAAGLSLITAGPERLALSLGWQMVSWLGHVGELWLTLYLMDAATSFAEATMLESLSLTARSAAFLIPSGWGAQEAALIGLAALTGLAPDTALALGLVKRAREFIVGLPGLAAWGFCERPKPAAPA